jgi:hypothetical protein
MKTHSVVAPLVNYHTGTFVVAPPVNYHSDTSIVASLVNYDAPTNLTSIIPRESHMTSEQMFLHIQTDLIEHVWN